MHVDGQAISQGLAAKAVSMGAPALKIEGKKEVEPKVENPSTMRCR